MDYKKSKSCKVCVAPKSGTFKVPNQTLLKNDTIKQSLKETKFYRGSKGGIC